MPPGSRHAIPMTATGVTLALAIVPHRSLPSHKFLSLLRASRNMPDFSVRAHDSKARLWSCGSQKFDPFCKNVDTRVQLPSRGTVVSVVVVSNRVAGPKADEPISGGLAAALIPMVSSGGATWVGYSGDVGNARRATEPLSVSGPSELARSSRSTRQESTISPTTRGSLILPCGRHYLNQEFSQSTLAGFYRTAQVGLVTPFHDGMNLVAKEFIAAQNPVDPDVLALSTSAGAAKELDAALLVSPHDVDSMARQIANALTMSIEERRERWQQMVAKLKRCSVQNWFSAFLDILSEARRTPPVPATQL
jgi:trehalose-6-phosphate synthase